MGSIAGMKKLIKRVVVFSAIAGIGYAIYKAVASPAASDETFELPAAPDVAGTRRRVVTATAKADGVITGLAGPWGEVSKADAIAQIQSGDYDYYVAGASDYALQVVEGASGPYLRTEPGGGVTNNLDQLPDA